MAELTLNVIGCGRVGRTLAKLWAQSHTFEIGDVFDRTLTKSEAAVAFIGSGRPAGGIADMRSAGVWMLAPPDAQIAGCCAALAQTTLLTTGNIVFHCSGALPSGELAPARARGAVAASVHPLKSFADPADAVRTFGGTYCAAEGDGAALAVLRLAFEGIGASVAEIDPGVKTIYHAASVIVCNYLTALIETGLRCYEKSGYERGTALRMMEPLVRETLDNVFRSGTVKALTGPIARGDDKVVARQIEALAQWEPRIAAIYRELGTVAVSLARAQSDADPAALSEIERTLDNEQTPPRGG